MLSSVARLAGHKGEVLCLDASCGDGSSSGISSGIRSSSSSSSSSSRDPVLASGGEDGTVRLWDLQAGRASRAIMLPAADGDGSDNAVNAVCLGLSGASEHWVYAATGATVCGYDLRAPGMLLREPTRRFTPSRDEIGQLALHESGALAAADDAGEVRVYDVAGGAGDLLATLAGGHSSLCGCAAFRPGRPWELYSAGLDAVCVRWDWKAAASMASWPLARLFAIDEKAQLLNPRHAHCLSFAPDGGTFALALGDGSVEVRLAESGEPLAAVDAHRAAASQARFSPQLRAALLEHARTEIASVASASTSAQAAVSLDAAAACEGLASGSALPLLSTGDDRQLRLWSVEGASGRGADGGRDGDGGTARSKRQRSTVAGAEGASRMDDDDDDDDDQTAGAAEPGFRALAAVTLPEKPNWVAGVSDASSQRAVVCVATTGALIDVLRM